MTVIEIPDFITAAGRLITETEREGLVAFVVTNQEVGDVIPETGGVRKTTGGACRAVASANPQLIRTVQQRRRQ